jgi:ribonuclease HIII
MDFQITNERKREICNQTLTAFLTELYSQLAYLGIDPETFSIDAYEESEDFSVQAQHNNLTNIVNKIKFIKTQLETLD